MGRLRSSAMKLLLAVPAGLYRLAVTVRNRRYSRPGACRTASLPVVSIGNLTAGGTGKTPMTAWLCTGLSSCGLFPAVVSRGYGGTAGKGPVTVSRGEGPIVGPEKAGDEPYMLAGRLPGIPVLVGSDRLSCASRAASLGADCIVLDDGFQHRRIRRELDIVLLDAGDPFGGGRLLPAGLLREPVSAISRAGLVVITRAEQAAGYDDIAETVRRYNRAAAIVTARHTPSGFVNSSGQRCPAPERAVAFCGIGNPGSFRGSLEACNVRMITFQTYRDHHRYKREQLEKLAGLAAAEDAVLVTTEKDLARICGSGLIDGLSIVALSIEIEVEEAALVMETVLDAIERSRT